MKLRLLFLILFSFLFSGAISNNQILFSKLQGIWMMNDDGFILFEDWKPLNSNSLIGRSYRIDHADTIILETMTLKYIDTDLYYIPTVIDQNEGKAVKFKLISNANDLYIFENKLHDFPQRINYQFIGNDSISASIEGEAKGEQQKINFNYKRIK
jgi:hypothetical protein